MRPDSYTRAYAVDTAGFARIEDLRREQIVPGPADWLRPPELEDQRFAFFKRNEPVQ